jgi:hypothetical protein
MPLGLAVLLGIDHVAQIIRSKAHRSAIGGIINAGYFPDHDGNIPLKWVARRTDKYGFNVTEIRNGYPAYASKIREMSRMMNSKGGFNAKCVASRAQMSQSDDCGFAENAIPYISTPLFLFQVKPHIL